MVRHVIATLVAAGLAAWWFSPTATGAPELAPIVPAGGPSDKQALNIVGSTVERVVDRPDNLVSRLVRFSTGRSAPAAADYPASPTSLVPPDWVMRTPARQTQREKTSQARGINPCLSPDPGFGKYTKWDRSPSIGQMIVPKSLRLDERGEFPVVIHFHGHEAARKEWVQAVDDAVLVGIDLGANSGPYLRKFSDPSAFASLLTSVEEGVALALNVAGASDVAGGLDVAGPRIGLLGISSWSAGYGAVERVLESEFADRVDSVMLLDGLHTGPADSARARTTLAPFVEYARSAAAEQTLMYVSHSSIVPPTYASTTETANYLVWQLGGRPQSSSPRKNDPMGLELIREYTDGEFHVRGFSGNGKLDHCAHLGLYRRAIRNYLAPRWGLTLAD